MASGHRISAGSVSRLAALSVLWGSTFILVHEALASFSAPVTAFLRCATASVVLALVCGRETVRGFVRVVGARPGAVLLLALVQVGLPYLAISAGQTEVDASLTAILVASSPIIGAALAFSLDRTEIPSPRHVVGLLIGIAGVALTVGGGSLDSLREAMAAAAVLFGAFCYALGALMTRRYGELAPYVLTLATVVGGAVLLAIPAAASLPDEAPSLGAVAAVTAAGVGGTALAWLTFYRLVEEAGAGFALLNAYLAPGVAVIAGVVFLEEDLPPAALVGLGLIVAGVAVVGHARQRLRST